jgi:uncharacterized membrane protein HdeD (DUF308 family)
MTDMQLERNPNQALSGLYIASGVLMIAAASLLFRLLTPQLRVVAIVGGVLSIISGYLRH